MTRRRRTDKERMDRLGKRGGGTVSFTPQMGGGIYVWEFGGRDYPKGVFWRSLRRFLDAAISAESMKGKEAGS